MPLPYARFHDGSRFESPISKVVCVGRNYAEHAKELENPVPAQPLLFMKPPSSVVRLEDPIVLPPGNEPVHYETELALLIGRTLRAAGETTAMEAIAGVGLALDLTLRERQSQLKASGHPWEVAKAFDGACPLSAFVPIDEFRNTDRFRFSLSVDAELRQDGDTADMIKPVPALLSYMSEHFTLEPGDVILTGTPAGVGRLESGQQLALTLEDRLRVETNVS
ncbi:2-keto-4-pentenoate hydratase/2-oxohepta-3-ene-1,7-dioic acid hydratase in catechol pathway [Halospina denitrificans]|uniref:2-keto-4-pentenoate hydratase/2-oxohepta-3-ene-1,7-dioic acid hydratase in catechol pathway n=1 Tax=Halospina denitrificans TaxID=332522 RepID=A0A4R7JXW4_9GAMM|nr:fumarylacetoacetate hydrolase family protein [Halospina denitrificans]TDT43341.1 2-keto-4-pentenoate hydratase/2-oxohepta-3-ene-1,7-dioic acid hydratase in catechol pathway [Halospina denitrificans]